MKKICHTTSVHTRCDTRIFIRECKSLSKASYDVSLIVADNQGDEIRDGIKIIDVGLINESRFSRMTKTVWNVYKKALETDANIYHFHDTELIPIGLLLKLKGRKVIYDVHEDLPREIEGKPYLKKWIKPIISKSVRSLENFSAKRFNAIITATPFIRNRFQNLNKNCIDINNYPILDEFNVNSKWEDKKKEICYIGSITKVRGITELVESLQYVDIVLNLGGSFSSEDFENELKRKKEWSKVNYSGLLNRKEVSNVLSISKAGIVTFYPLPNHINAQPNKMFEYMSAGIPVIASNFPLWRKIIEENNCGICVNPKNPKEIANAINYLLTHNEEAEMMGKNGRRAVEEIYNWKNEERKLIKIYKGL